MAMMLPASRVVAVGRASQSTTTANMNPSGTRRRATRLVRSATATLRRGEAPFNGIEDFGRVDVEQAHAFEPALSQMMASTHRRARHRLIVRTERTIAFRPGWSVDADQRRAHG